MKKQKSKNPAPKKKLNAERKPSYAALALVICFAFYLAAGWFVVTRYYRTSSATEVSLASGQTFTGNDYRSSLDLRVAKKATYPSEKLISTEDLGTFNGVKRYIVKFKVGADKLEEYGLMSLPASDPPPGGYPVILLLHAYTFPAEYDTKTSYLADMDYYSQQGFAVIKPDLRGHGLSASVGQPEGANFSMAYITDLMSLIKSVKLTGYLNPKAINLWGHSMGAGLALKASVLSGDIKSAILLAGPVSDYTTMYESYIAPSDVNNPVAAGIKAKQLIKFGTPETNPGYWYYASPINYLKNSHTYFQIHVGSADQVVPASFSADLDSRLNSLHKKHGYFVHQGGDHNLGAFRETIWRESLPVLSRGN